MEGFIWHNHVIQYWLCELAGTFAEFELVNFLSQPVIVNFNQEIL